MPSLGVAAVDRALTILAAFEGEATPLTLAELARRTGLYKSTLLRLMASLQEFGYIVQLSDGRYHLGPTPFRLGAVYQRANNLYDHVMPVLRQLVAAGTESASFHVRHDAERRLCVFRVDSQHSTLDRVEAGMLLPLDRGAAGRVILAFDSEKSETFDRIGENCIVNSFGERDPDCAGMACPVFGPNRKLAGALSLSGPMPRFNKENTRTMSSLLLKAAVRLTRSLGGPAALTEGIPTPSPIESHGAEMRPSRRMRK
jgi:DNA-binding IclR family transcriptional regulator